MTKKLQIGNDVFDYPVQGDGNYGEEATAWAERVTETLGLVEGPNDIITSTATLDNNQTTPADISGLNFNTASVLSVDIEFFVKREGASVTTENGNILLNYNGVSWQLVQEGNGDAGVIFSITSVGQVQYTSTDIASHVGSSIRFRARTIDEP